MLTFKPIEPQDAQWVTPLLHASGYMTSTYAFVTLYLWSKAYDTQVARFGDHVIARSHRGGIFHYLYPSGHGDEKATVDAIIEDAKAQSEPAWLYGVSVEAKQRLEQWYPGLFTIEAVRDDYEYIYDRAELADLPGKKFQKKRNHVSRFIRENPDWEFHTITEESLPLVRQFNREWAALADNKDDPGIQMEHEAIEMVFDHYTELPIEGCYITAGGRVVAYSFGSAINDRIFDTNVEKALYEVNGAYNIINREMARQVCARYEMINREDDVGSEGLRKAKLSYNPIIIEPKYRAVLNK